MIWFKNYDKLSWYTLKTECDIFIEYWIIAPRLFGISSYRFRKKCDNLIYLHWIEIFGKMLTEKYKSFYFSCTSWINVPGDAIEKLLNCFWFLPFPVVYNAIIKNCTRSKVISTGRYVYYRLLLNFNQFNSTLLLCLYKPIPIHQNYFTS